MYFLLQWRLVFNHTCLSLYSKLHLIDIMAKRRESSNIEHTCESRITKVRLTRRTLNERRKWDWFKKDWLKKKRLKREKNDSNIVDEQKARTDGIERSFSFLLHIVGDLLRSEGSPSIRFSFSLFFFSPSLSLSLPLCLSWRI